MLLLSVFQTANFVLTAEARAILVAVKFVSSCDKLICSDFLSSHLAIESCKIQITVLFVSNRTLPLVMTLPDEGYSRNVCTLNSIVGSTWWQKLDNTSDLWQVTDKLYHFTIKHVLLTV